MKLVQDLEIITNIIILANGLELVKEDLGMINILNNQNMMIVNQSMNLITVKKKKILIVLKNGVIKKTQKNLKELKEVLAENKWNQDNIAIKRMIVTQRSLKELKNVPAENKWNPDKPATKKKIANQRKAIKKIKIANQRKAIKKIKIVNQKEAKRKRNKHVQRSTKRLKTAVIIEFNQENQDTIEQDNEGWPNLPLKKETHQISYHYKNLMLISLMCV